MTTIIKSMFFTPTAAFAWFAILLAARDISAEIFLSEDAISLAFAICATIVALSFAMIVFTGTGKDLLEKLTKPGVLWRAVQLPPPDFWWSPCFGRDHRFSGENF